MKTFFVISAAVLCAYALGAASGEPTASSSAASVTVARRADLQIETGPEKYFTGRVQIAGQFQREEPSRVTGAIVSFQPRARTAWHSHPAGQTLIVMKGIGLVQSWGGPRQEIREGDIVWTPPGVKHWHGASIDGAMSHVAIQEKIDGKNVEWMEHVTDEQYSAKGE